MEEKLSNDLVYLVRNLKNGFDRARHLYATQMHKEPLSADAKCFLDRCPSFNRAAGAAMAMELLARNFKDNDYIKVPGRLLELPTSSGTAKSFQEYFLAGAYSLVDPQKLDDSCPIELYSLGQGLKTLEF